MVVNIRYTLSWCIFGIPGFGDHSSISPCGETCRNISDAVEKNILNATASSTYDYCDELNSPTDLSPCASCYSPIKTQLYISNCRLSHHPCLPLLTGFFFLFFSFLDLNFLRSACELKIPIPTPFPILGSQLFTSTPPDNYSPSRNSTSKGLSRSAKLAIGIAIPSTLLLLVPLAILLWYIRDYKRKRSSISDQIPRFPSPPTKPLPHYKPFPPPKPITKQNKPSPSYPAGPPPTIFHPTPRLRKLSPSSPVAKPLQPRRPRPHVAAQFIFTHPIHYQHAAPNTRATSVTTSPISLLSSPPPRSALRSSSRMPPRSRGVVKFEPRGGGRKRRRRKVKKGWKDRGKLEVLFR